MGLDLSYKEQDKVGLCRPYIATKAYNQSKDGSLYETTLWDKMYNIHDAHTKICKTCPLECENERWHERGLYGCYIRMGSYSYVASLHDFIDVNYKMMLGNIFVQATKGGGYHPEDIRPTPTQQDMLSAIKELRAFLKSVKCEAAVPYFENEPVSGCFVGASKQTNSIGMYDWIASIGGKHVGVHYGLGIGTWEDGEYPRYAHETNDDTVIKAFSHGGKDITVDMVRFEELPAIDIFDHLLDTAQRILEKAIKYDLTVEGC